MAFSAGVKLGNLDDYLDAADDCIKPLINAKKDKEKQKAGGR